MDTIKQIIEQQKKFQGKGALKDKPSHKDYRAEEILAGVEIVRPSFEEGYSVIKKVWSSMPYKNQWATFSCVGQAAALYKQILQKLDTGEETELSAFSLYNPVAFPGTGSYIRDVMNRTVGYGVNKESTLPSPKDEATMTQTFDFTSYGEEAAFYKNRLVATVSTQDFEKLADMLFINNGLVSGWGSHAVYFGEYGMLNGKRFLKTPNSYGEGNDLYYFEGMSPLFSAWTAIDLKIITQDSDALYADLKYGDKGTQVLKLKKALKRLGWGEARGVALLDGNTYDDNLAWIVMNYKLAHIYDHNIWGRFFEKWRFKGHSVDQRTRENINFNLLKR